MRTYTPEQAAEVLQVTPDTIRRLARENVLQGSKIGNYWRFTEEDLRAFLASQRPTRRVETTP